MYALRGITFYSEEYIILDVYFSIDTFSTKDLENILLLNDSSANILVLSQTFSLQTPTWMHLKCLYGFDDVSTSCLGKGQYSRIVALFMRIVLQISAIL